MKYVKPELNVTVFELNQAIAACETTTESKWNNQTVYCVVNGSETIFYDGCANDANNGRLVTIAGNAQYPGGIYYVWKTGSASGNPPTPSQQEILNQCGISGPGWHAGPATPEIITVHNMS